MWVPALGGYLQARNVQICLPTTRETAASPPLPRKHRGGCFSSSIDVQSQGPEGLAAKQVLGPHMPPRGMTALLGTPRL